MSSATGCVALTEPRGDQQQKQTLVLTQVIQEEDTESTGNQEVMMFVQ